jgi:hypothetical protein
MRRIVVIVALLAVVACRRETTNPQPAQPPSAVSRPPSAEVPTTPPPKLPLRSTPQKCAGDGSYEAALDCIRMAAALRFHSTDGDGEMVRRTMGAERLSVHAAGGEWIAEAKKNGIVWTHNGQHATDVAPALEKLWERLTIFPDPQKKEGTPQLSMEGDVRRYDFTDVNTGDRYKVWVAPGDGHITKLQVNSSTISFE